MYKLTHEDELLVQGARMMVRSLADYFRKYYKGGKLNVSVDNAEGSPFQSLKCDPVEVINAVNRLDYFDILNFAHEHYEDFCVEYEFEVKANSKGAHSAVFKGLKNAEKRSSKAFELLCKLLGKEDE